MDTPLRPPAGARAPGPWHGLTLIELTIALAVLALLMTMGVPPMASWMGRHRLRATAQHLAADLGEARHEAVRRGQTLHVRFQTGRDWCYSVALRPDADCRQPDAQVLKTVRARDHAGVQLVDARPLEIDGRDGNASALRGYGRFASPQGDELQVRLLPIGRAGLCVPEAEWPDIARC